MGLFRRKPKEVFVRVAYRDLTDPVPEFDANRHYVFSWGLGEAPERGVRVMVPGGDNRGAFGVVTGPATAADVKGHTVKPVIGVVDEAQIAAAVAKKDAELDAWLRMAMKAAGLPGAGRVRTKVPAGFDEIPPADGEASAADAGEYGRGWWRIAKRGEEFGLDEEVTKKFRSIAHRWYAIRDRG